MSDKGSIVDRVRDYIKSTDDIELLGISEISDRAAVVLDNWNETDVYFDAGSYNPIIPQIWLNEDGTNSLTPPKLKRQGLGVLPGLGRAPRVNGYEDGLEFAISQLEPTVKEAEFYERPVLSTESV